jgi:uncharacterized membrane protein (UPF0127 family)
MTMRSRIPLGPLAGLLIFLLAVSAAGAAERFAADRLAIETRTGRHELTVEVARTWAQRAQGLQHRKHLAADRGMLFDYGRPQIVTMWMKNTYIPLDMLFVAADGKIIRIVRNTVPLSLARISSEWPVRAVIEVAAGTVRNLGILEGDRVVHPIFGTAAPAVDEG